MTEKNTICYPLPVLTDQECENPFLSLHYPLGTSCDGIKERCFPKPTREECQDPIYHLTNPFVFGCADYRDSQNYLNSSAWSQNPPSISTKPVLPTFLLGVAALTLFRLSLKKLKRSFHQEQRPQVQKDIEPTETEISTQDSYYQLRKSISLQNDKAHSFIRDSIEQYLSRQEQPSESQTFSNLFFYSSNSCQYSSGSQNAKSSENSPMNLK